MDVQGLPAVDGTIAAVRLLETYIYSYQSSHLGVSRLLLPLSYHYRKSGLQHGTPSAPATFYLPQTKMSPKGFEIGSGNRIATHAPLVLEALEFHYACRKPEASLLCLCITNDIPPPPDIYSDSLPVVHTTPLINKPSYLRVQLATNLHHISHCQGGKSTHLVQTAPS